MRSLLLSHNNIQGVDDNLFSYGLRVVDLSHNDISGHIPALTDPTSRWETILFNDNPRMVSPSGNLPRWATVSSTSLLKQNGTTFVCPQLGTVLLETAVLAVDGSYYLYSLCICDKGTYGVPPDCPSIPAEVNLLPPSYNGSIIAGLDWSTPNSAYTSFTDGAYGYQRVIGGMDTSFLINSTQLLYSTRSYDASRPVLGITIQLWFTPVFSAFADVLTVYEGGADLKGTRVASYRGSDFTSGYGMHHTSYHHLLQLIALCSNI